MRYRLSSLRGTPTLLGVDEELQLALIHQVTVVAVCALLLALLVA